jgi:8-oxo-dGTP diphosphatase
MISPTKPKRIEHTKADVIAAVSVDCVIFGLEEGRLKVLLIQRSIEPSKGLWALIGGFVLEQEDLDMSAKRVLEDLTGLTDIYMEQIYTFGNVKRFPWRRVITTAYCALINLRRENLEPGPDASAVDWFDIAELPELVFDHRQILDRALSHLSNKVRLEPIGFELLPPKFTLTQLQSLYEAVLDTKLDTRNFRKKILKMNMLVMLDEKQQGVAHRAAQLYRFDKEKYNQLKAAGFTFEV